MPTLKKIVVQDFRNIAFQELQFSPNVNCISGNNGEGKTNLMDAIYYLSMTKSAFPAPVRYNWRYGTDGFVLGGTYAMENGLASQFSLRVGEEGKKLVRDEKACTRMSDHIGLLPVVMVSPGDSVLVSDAGEDRRRLSNAVLSQMDPAYLAAAVKNTNGGNNCDLKRAEEEGIIDATRKLPKLLEDKINIINDMKRREKEDEKRLLSQVKKKINEEIKKQKEKDEIRFKREIDEIEQKRENIRQERMRLMEELQNHEIEESESEQINLNSPHNYFQNMNPQVLPPPSIPQIMSPYTFPPNMYPSLNNRNNNKDSTGELLKIFLLKKMFDDKSQTIQNTPQIQPQPQYIPPPYPPQYQQPPPQPQQPITIPQPIILQSPQTAMSPPNIIIQQERSQPQISPQIQPQIIQPQIKYKDIVITKSESIKSEKGIPFVDPLENYLKETKVKKKSYPKEKKKTTAKKTQEYEEMSAAGRSLSMHRRAFLSVWSSSGWRRKRQPSIRSLSTATVTEGNFFAIWSGSSPKVAALPSRSTFWKPRLFLLYPRDRTAMLL